MPRKEYRVQFQEDAAGCCQYFYGIFRKKLCFIVVCVLLLIALLSVIVALYQGISLNEFSSLAIGLGIWLPSIVLGMICVYTVVICSQKSTITTSDLPSDGNSILTSQSNNESSLNIVGYQPEISQELPEIPLQVKQETVKHPRFIRNYENLPNDQSNKLQQRKHFRSLSSSNLNRYNNKQNRSDRNPEECGYSRERVDHDEYTSRNKSQQELNPRRRKLRSFSETRTLKYEDLGFSRNASHDNNDNELLHSLEVYNERNHFSRMEEQNNSKNFNTVAEESLRVRDNSEKQPLRKNKDFLKYRYGTDNFSSLGYMERNEHLMQFQTNSPQAIGTVQNYPSKKPCTEENGHLQLFQKQFPEGIQGMKKYPPKKPCTNRIGHLQRFQTVSQESVGEIPKFPSKKPCTEENRHLHRFPTGSPKRKNGFPKYPSKLPCVEGSGHLQRFQTDSSKNASGIKQYSLKKPCLTIEGNRPPYQFQTDSSESTDGFQNYSFKMPCKSNFSSSSVIYHPQEHSLMSHDPPRNMDYFKNNQNETDNPSRIENGTSFKYKSFEIPNSSRDNRTFRDPTNRSFRGKNGVDDQFSRPSINGFQSLQNFADIGYLPNGSKAIKNILPVNRSNVEINSSDHSQIREFVPFLNLQPPPQMNCFLQTENNSQALGHSMLKRRSPREKSKIMVDPQNITGFNHIPPRWDSR